MAAAPQALDLAAASSRSRSASRRSSATLASTRAAGSAEPGPHGRSERGDRFGEVGGGVRDPRS
jgi:hypothetical protein